MTPASSSITIATILTACFAASAAAAPLATPPSAVSSSDLPSCSADGGLHRKVIGGHRFRGGLASGMYGQAFFAGGGASARKPSGHKAMRIVPVVIVAAALGACSGHPFQRFFSSGEQYLAKGHYPEAVIQFQNAARADPQSSAAQMKLGEAYVALQDP